MSDVQASLVLSKFDPWPNGIDSIWNISIDETKVIWVELSYPRWQRGYHKSLNMVLG